ncbi:MAG: FecR family protein [Treponema sp.]|jgi:hypothetical protein|nr:FecR family protein [Treponema sp.]
MKKTSLLFVLFCAAACLFAQNGIIRELTGEVLLKPVGAAEFTAAVAGDAVAANTIVSTGFKSTAIITIGSSIIAVRPLTRLSLSELQSNAGTETVNVNLQVGRVKVDVKPPAGTRANFTVRGPSATASVRGTSFEFDTVNIFVSEGTVAFQGASGSSVPVPAGSSSDISSVDGKASDSFEATIADLLPPLPKGADKIIQTPSGAGEFQNAGLSITIQY